MHASASTSLQLGSPAPAAALEAPQHSVAYPGCTALLPKTRGTACYPHVSPCCSALQDVLHRFKETGHKDFSELPKKACFQMNDTHPTIAVAELMRLLIDQEGLDWDKAWGITKQVGRSSQRTILM